MESTKQQYPGKTREPGQRTILLHSKDWRIRERDCQDNPNLKYCKSMESCINKGYLEYVDTKEKTYNGWFLLHFVYICPDKLTRKVRILCDNTAKYEGKSINDVIHPGPKLQQDLINVLLRFRRYPLFWYATQQKCILGLEYVQQVDHTKEYSRDL